MKEHIIVCGAGRTGQRIAQEVRDRGDKCVLIEKDEQRARMLRREGKQSRLIRGDATSDEVLKSAGIERASGLVACLSGDADSLFVCLSARSLAGEELQIIARARAEESISKMRLAGADEVVSPSVSTALSVVGTLNRS